MAHSTAAALPQKPHPDFPLTPRADGRWCKRINGRLRYISGTADEALAEWLRVKDHWLAGRTTPPKDIRRSPWRHSSVTRNKCSWMFESLTTCGRRWLGINRWTADAFMLRRPPESLTSK